MKGSIVLSWGEYGGFYIHRGYTTRLCFGWLAITHIPLEIDDVIHNPEKYNALSIIQKEYIDFLNKANEAPISMAWIHGWRCPQEDIDKGNELREKIKQIENE